VNRRDFLKIAGIGTLGIATGVIVASEAKPDRPWENCPHLLRCRHCEAEGSRNAWACGGAWPVVRGACHYFWVHVKPRSRPCGIFARGVLCPFAPLGPLEPYPPPVGHYYDQIIEDDPPAVSKELAPEPDSSPSAAPYGHDRQKKAQCPPYPRFVGQKFMRKSLRRRI